jgi:hypothetical protein
MIGATVHWVRDSTKMVRFGSLPLAFTTAIVLASMPARAKDTFECEIKQWLDLTEAGLVPHNSSFAISRRFWLDKKNPMIAGAALAGEHPEWSVVKSGGPAQSFLMVGRALGFDGWGLSFILYEASAGGEPSPFVFTDLYGPFQGFTGLCR